EVLSDVVGTIAVTTLLYGRADPIHNPAGQTASEIAGAQFVSIPGLDHIGGRQPGRLSIGVPCPELSTIRARRSRVKSSTPASPRNFRAAGQGVRHEVQRPALVRPLWQRHRRPRSDRPLTPAALANHQPFLAIEPVELLVVQ